jgi:uncharacterized protein DUF4190
VTTADDTPHWRAQQTNRLANASMVCGILALVFTPLAILAIVFGHIARGQISRTREGGHRKATAGLVLGYVVLVAVGIMLVVAFLVLPGPQDSVSTAAANGSKRIALRCPRSLAIDALTCLDDLH